MTSDSAITRAIAAIEPFREAAAYLHPALPDDGETLDGIKVRQWLALSAAQAELREIAERMEGLVCPPDFRGDEHYEACVAFVDALLLGVAAGRSCTQETTHAPR